MLAGEEFWDDILAHLKQRLLVSFVGPELLTVKYGDRIVTLSSVIAERLAERYNLVGQVERSNWVG